MNDHFAPDLVITLYVAIAAGWLWQAAGRRLGGPLARFRGPARGLVALLAACALAAIWWP